MNEIHTIILVLIVICILLIIILLSIANPIKVRIIKYKPQTPFAYFSFFILFVRKDIETLYFVLRKGNEYLQNTRFGMLPFELEDNYQLPRLEETDINPFMKYVYCFNTLLKQNQLLVINTFIEPKVIEILNVNPNLYCFFKNYKFSISKGTNDSFYLFSSKSSNSVIDIKVFFNDSIITNKLKKFFATSKGKAQTLSVFGKVSYEEDLNGNPEISVSPLVIF